MKRLLELALLCALSGCAQSHFPPGVSGEAVPVNSPATIAEVIANE